jgi:hypothetical protein
VSADIPVVEAPATVVEMPPAMSEEGRMKKQDAEHLERSVMTAGQRRVNLLWEITQSTIAIVTVGTCMFVFVHQALTGVPEEFPATLSNMVFAVLAFYLARTNHQAIGGTGNKPGQPYIGR